MCGISGVISTTPLRGRDADAVARMNSHLFHRGPDSEGRFTSENVILAMRRLSIIDLVGGQQPLYNETGDIAVVCNGEIYNFVDLRRELEALGHRFATHSDVETIVHAYEAWGDGFLERLRGMFAIALWDSKCKRLILARDRLGEKPLYYHRDASGHLWFSSELRSLFAAMTDKPRLTPKAFNLFLTFQYLPEPETPVAGVRQLPAGHFLDLSPENLDAEPRRYWDPSTLREDPAHPVKTVERALDEACHLMGTADVPVAVALSGGIDSSLVAALTARHFPRGLHAFTIGYTGRPSTDERSQAEELAKALGIGFTEVEISDDEVVAEFPRMMAAMDTPIADIAAYGYYAVSRAAREAGYPVLLSGTGGDEFFWGYQWVRDAVNRNEAYLASKGWRYWLAKLTGRPTGKLDFFGVHAALRDGDTWSRRVMPHEARAQVPEGFWLDMNSLDPALPVHLAVTTLLNRTWLQSNCLALADRMSMANSVEVRLPLLDVDLVNKVTGMRNAGLTDWTQPHKALLVQALQHTLPAEVLERKKQGFTPPVRRWMEGIVARFRGLVPNGSLVRQGLLEAEQAKAVFGQFDLSFQYKLVFLECWSRLHLEGATAQSLADEVKG
jgi:asparagine synthase (glutamine-hydrolysing)